MKDRYDPEFENRRLAQLCAECLHGEDINGEVVFYCLRDKNQLEAATWFFSAEDMALARESGFKTMLMRFLDDHISWRARLGLENNRGGCVKISGSQASIEWLPDDEAERLIEQKRNTAAGID